MIEWFLVVAYVWILIAYVAYAGLSPLFPKSQRIELLICCLLVPHAMFVIWALDMFRSSRILDNLYKREYAWR